MPGWPVSTSPRKEAACRPHSNPSDNLGATSSDTCRIQKGWRVSASGPGEKSHGTRWPPSLEADPVGWGTCVCALTTQNKRPPSAGGSEASPWTEEAAWATPPSPTLRRPGREVMISSCPPTRPRTGSELTHKIPFTCENGL